MATSQIQGKDVDEMFDIVKENGGSGEWEDGADSDITPRWLFPRFVPLCHVCHQQMTLKPSEDEDVEEAYLCETKACKNTERLVMDNADMYLSRSGVGQHDTDVETLAAWLAAPRNIVGASLLLGEPGTGKTALIEAAVTHADRTLTTIVCTPDHTKDSLFLRFVGEGKGDELADGQRSPYTLGPIPYAAKHGHTLYMDEFLLLMDGVKPLVYPLADGRRFLPEGNVDGSAMEIHPDFRLVLSSNPMVRGASLPEPIGSRCASTTLTVETDAAMLRDLDIDESIVAAWEHLGDSGLWRPQIREIRMAQYWLEIDKTQAASAFLPEHCPESQRGKVRDAVISYIGGDLRADGRLVVS